MTQYDVEFSVVVKRRIEVPDGLVWHEAFKWAAENFGWRNIACSAAAMVVVPENPAPLNFVLVTLGGTDGTE